MWRRRGRREREREGGKKQAGGFGSTWKEDEEVGRAGEGEGKGRGKEEEDKARKEQPGLVQPRRKMGR